MVTQGDALAVLRTMTKSERYFYDMEAVKEEGSPDSHARYARGRSDTHKWSDGGPGNQTIAKGFEHMRQPGVNPKSTQAGFKTKQNESFSAAVKDVVESRNLRSWWQINPEYVGIAEARVRRIYPLFAG